MTHEKQKHIFSDHTYTVTVMIYAFSQQYGSIAQQIKFFMNKKILYISQEG